MKKLLAYTLAFAVSFIALAQTPADSTKVYFRMGSRQFEPSYKDNRVSIDRFVNKVREAAEAGDLESVTVRAYASPEGGEKLNLSIAQSRSDVIADYIAERSGVSRDIITAEPGEIAWDELRRMVAVTPDVPSRDELLNIIDNTPIWVYDANGKLIDSRKNRLMALANGNPYRWIYANLFPELRSAVAVSFHSSKPQPVTDETVEVPAVELTANATGASENESASRTEQDSIAIPPDAPAVSQPAAAVVNAREFVRDRFALKTNLLFDAALLPNLEIEWLVNDTWSVAIDGGVAWWKNTSKNKFYQLAYVTPEVRYHIAPRAPWHGMYVGVFGGGGLYDLENGKTGYRGEGYMGGASFGYMWPIGKHLSLEAGIGVGYLHTEFKEYRPLGGHYVYQRTKSVNYVGPLKLKFSIAWRFGAIYKPLQINTAL